MDLWKDYLKTPYVRGGNTIPGRLSRMAPERGHFPSCGRLRILLVARGKYKIRFRPDTAVSRDRVPLNVDHLTLAERSLVAGLLQGRGPRADLGQRAHMMGPVGVRLESCQAFRQHSTVACRSRVGPRERPPPASPTEILVDHGGVLVLDLPFCERRARGRGDDGGRGIGHSRGGRRLCRLSRRRGVMLATREHVNRRLPVDLVARCFWRTGFGHAGTSADKLPRISVICYVQGRRTCGERALFESC